MISNTEVTGRAVQTRQVPLVVQILTTTGQTKGKEVQKGKSHLIVSPTVRVLSKLLVEPWTKGRDVWGMVTALLISTNDLGTFSARSILFRQKPTETKSPRTL